MKITCSTCAARYSVPDERIRGRAVRVRCKRCGAPIQVEGPAGEWHVALGGETLGPWTDAELTARVDAGEVDGETFVWREGMDEWAEARTVTSLAARLPGREPEPFHASETRVTSAPNPNLTGERNESSVLFSLSNLGAMASAPTSPAVESTPTTEGSGLIDIRKLAQAIADEPKPTPSPDELLAFGGGDLGSPLGAPVVLPEKADDRGKAPIVAGSVVAALAIAAAAAVVAWVELDDGPRPLPPPTPVTDDAPAPPSPAPMGVTAPEPSSPTDVTLPDETPAPEPEAIPEPEATRTRTQTRTRTRPRTRTRTQTPDPTPDPTPARAPTASPDPLAEIFDEPARPARPAPRPDLPDTPSRSDVVSAMRGVEAPVRACGEGAHGTAVVRLRFGSDGRVRSADVQGAGLPASVRSCVARAARGAAVSRFAQDSFSVTYPFRL